jgi:hypothetical protein
MRSYQVFASMQPERAVALLRSLNETSPTVVEQAVAAAAFAMKARPVYLKKQPFEKRAHAVRRALARVASDPVAAEVLAVYFLKCRNELLCEWLDALGLKHEEGVLEADAPEQPAAAELEKKAKAFLAVASDDEDRPLLLAAFAAQDAIDWPALEAQIAPSS